MSLESGTALYQVEFGSITSRSGVASSAPVDWQLNKIRVTITKLPNKMNLFTMNEMC